MLALHGGVGLIERAIGHTLGSLQAVTPAALARPTPCQEWDLATLLWHLNDSMLALTDAIDAGHVGLDPAADLAPTVCPVTTFRQRANRLLGAWAGAGEADVSVTVAGCPMPASLIARTGAIEIAVHGWDIDRSMGVDRSISGALAGELLGVCRLTVTADERPVPFGYERTPPARAGAAARLLAFLGRDPAWAPPSAG